MDSFLSNIELKEIGFASVGQSVMISRKASFYFPERISLGNNVRIDDFCVLSACTNGYIKMGSFIHIGAHCLIEATAGVEMQDFSGLSGRCTIYGSEANNSGKHLTNFGVPSTLRSIKSSSILLKEHAVIGASSVLLPGVSMGLCSAVGAMSLVVDTVPDFEIHAGIPAKFVKRRADNIITLGNEAIEAFNKNLKL